MLKRGLFIVKNKFVITSFAFLVWMIFFDRNDISSQMHYHNQKKELYAEKAFYEAEIEKVEQKFEELTSNPEKLQKFAREKYFMKKDNEDIYIVVEE